MTEWRGKPYWLWLGICILGAAALGTALGASAARLADVWSVLLLLGGLTLAVALFPVPIPGTVGIISVGDTFAFLALLLLGTGPAVLVAATDAVASTLRQTHRLRSVAFSTLNHALSLLFAGLIFGSLSGEGLLFLGTQQALQGMLLPLMVAALGHYLANSLGVAALTALSRRQRILETWRDHYLWASITYFSGAAAAALVFSLRHKAGWTSIGLSLPILSVTYFAYRVYLGKLAERQKYAEQILEINAGLELRIAERTSAIESVNQELATKNRELEKVSKMKAEFLAKMSHELRTPLNAIIGFSELLLHPRGRNFDEQQRAAFHQDILASGAHLLSLINDILDISKIEAGRTSFLPQLCELRPLIKKAISDFSPMAQAKGVQLTFSVHPLLQYVHLDPPKLTQILNNLISNAIKFTHSEGKVSVWVDAELPRTLVVQVVDNGIGIPAECQDKIFEAFYQVEASYSRSQDGSGLGLALVRELAHMHGGTASVESQPGVGSRFTVHLPGAVALEEESAAERPEKEIEESKIVPLHGRPAAQSAPLVLLVEDHPANARLATELLLGAGMEVLLATTAEEAFQLLRHHRRPSFILMDISLPRMDGLEATRRLRLDPELRDIPVIAVTAHAMTGDRERALEAGCIEHVSKPLDIEALYQVLQRVLDRTA